jgi:dihydrofolate synthase/folylpolyglutamate synthase
VDPGSAGSPGDEEVFFREWRSRASDERRSLERSRALAESLGLPDADRPVLAVVGSKGKGTAATYASAVLAAAGLRTGTVTSPAYRSNRERIRVDGEAIGEEDLAGLAGRLEGAMRRLPRRTRGYLSPSGLFLLAGALHAREAGLDVLVLEAGMGGRSDEISLFPPAVAAITPVFREHAGVLGDTVAEIAAEKAGAVAPGTRAVVSAPQTGEAAAALARTVRRITDGAVEPETLPAAGSGLPAGLLPAGLARTSAETGHLAALRLLEVRERPAPAAPRLRAVLETITLPGRLSWHTVPGTGTALLADSAIDRAGIAVALATARARWGRLDHVVVCLPDHKDLDGAIAELGGLPVTYARLPYDHLRFSRPLPEAWEVADAADLTPERLAGLGRRVVVLGTVYFVGLVLGTVGADTERLFRVP